MDDNLSLVLDKQTYGGFRTRWASVFTSSQTAKSPTNVAFAGLDFRRVDARTISIGGGEEIMNLLAAALDSARSFGAWPGMLSTEVPMASDALPKLQALASDDELPPAAAHHSLLPGC